MTPADWLIAVTIATVSILDVGLVLWHYPTVSRRMRLIGREVAFFPYAWGVLGGHFWGPHVEPVFISQLGSILLLIGIGLAFVGFHRLWREYGAPGWAALLYLPAGVPAGIFLWPQ